MIAVGLRLRVGVCDRADWMVDTFAAWSVNRSSVHLASFFKYLYICGLFYLGLVGWFESVPMTKSKVYIFFLR